jgi:hypothetical protein
MTAETFLLIPSFAWLALALLVVDRRLMGGTGLGYWSGALGGLAARYHRRRE